MDSDCGSGEIETGKDRIMPNFDSTLKCCDEMMGNSKVFVWAKANGWSDVENDGWAIMVHAWGDAAFISVKFCPFCGVKLSVLENLTPNG